MQILGGNIHGCCTRCSGILLILFFAFSIMHGTLHSQETDPCHFDYGYWSTLQAMPGTRSAMSGEMLAGRIYVIGGLSGKDDPAEFREEVWSYDPGSDRWDTTLAPLPVPRSFFGDHTCVLGNKLYVIGGTAADGKEPVYSARVDVYDPETDSWHMCADLPVALGGIGVCAIMGQIFVCGGINQDQQSLKTLYRYDPGTDLWHREPDMLTPRYRHAAVTVDGKLYAIGGISDPDAPAGLKLAEVFDPVTHCWASIASVPTQICEMASVAINHDIYLFGGKVTLNAGMLNRVFKYRVSTDSWSAVDELPGQLCLAAAVAAGRRIYLLGGTSSFEPGIDRIWTYDLSEVVLENKIPDLLMDKDSLLIDLSAYFSHATDGKIDYTVCDLSDPTIVSTWIYDSMLIIRGIDHGEVQIRILAESGNYRAGDSFSLTNLVTSIPDPLRETVTFTAFPNPVFEKLHLEARNTGTYVVAIRAIDGRLIYKKQITDPLYTIHLSHLPGGIYLVRAWNGCFEAREKLIKY